MNNLVFEKNRIYTKSKDKFSWYDEIVIKRGSDYLREWNPKTSKISAAIKKGLKVEFDNKSILYIGSSTGTTVSHLADLTTKPIVGVDIAPVVMREFLELAKIKENVYPLLYNGSELKECSLIRNEKFDIVFQDIAQRDMVKTFIGNFKHFSNKNSVGYLSLKTRSINSTISAKEVMQKAQKELVESGLKIERILDLEPFEKNHYFFVVRN